MTDQFQATSNFFPGVTIDAAHSRDLDDAVWVERDGEGWRVVVSIADVSTAVSIGCSDDHAAYAAGFTRYLATRAVRPMLPPALSEGRLTLSPCKPCSIMAVEMRLSPQRDVTHVQIVFGTLAHRGRLSHETASALIDGGDPGLHRMLADAWELSAQLLHDRKTGGALTYFSPKSGLSTDEEGNVVETGTQGPVSRAYIIVQELMILVNRTVAEHHARKGIPLLYRNHRANALANRDALCEDVEQVAENRGPASAAASNRLAMLLGRAMLDVQVVGHFGLNLPAYLWITSPIRRYADLVNQRIIKAVLLKQPAPYSSESLEAIARHLNMTAWDEAERRSAAFKEASERQARDVLAREKFSGLDQVGFQAVVKAAFAGDGEASSVSDSLAQEVVSRLVAGQLTEKEVARVLLAFGRVPTPLKAGVLQALGENTGLAYRTVDYMTQHHGLILFERDEVVEGPPHARRFLCRARARLGSELYEGMEVGAGRRSDAQQRASLALLSRVSHADWQPPAEWVSVMPAKVVTPPVKARMPNWKGKLQELCQKRQWPLPVYDLAQSGPDHAPSFHGTACIEVSGSPVRRSMIVVGASRKEAEHRAAADLLEKLTER